MPWNLLDVLHQLLHARSTTGGLHDLVIIVFILFSLGAVGLWMYLLTTLVELFDLPIILVVGFIIPASLIISAFFTLLFIGIYL